MKVRRPQFSWVGAADVHIQAYLGPDGKARLFRPDLSMRRLERSMARLALPVSRVAPLSPSCPHCV
jgi:hypothetical protein